MDQEGIEVADRQQVTEPLSSSTRPMCVQNVPLGLSLPTTEQGLTLHFNGWGYYQGEIPFTVARWPSKIKNHQKRQEPISIPWDSWSLFITQSCKVRSRNTTLNYFIDWEEYKNKARKELCKVPVLNVLQWIFLMGVSWKEQHFVLLNPADHEQFLAGTLIHLVVESFQLRPPHQARKAEYKFLPPIGKEVWNLACN